MVALVSQENVVALVSRTGRELQRYRKGRRQVVGFVYSLSSLLLIHVSKSTYQKKTFFFIPQGFVLLWVRLIFPLREQ